MINKFTDAIHRDINEETDSADISYLPGSFDTAQSLVRDLSRIKKRWNVEILEDEDSYKVMFEDALKVTIPKQYFEDFNKNVIKVTGVTVVDLTGVLNESIMEVSKSAYDRLHKALTQDFKRSTNVMRSLTLMNTWLRTYRNSRFVPSTDKVAIRLETFDADAKKLVTTLKKTYGEDLGGVDTLVDAIENGRAIGHAQGYEYIVGTKIQSAHLDVRLTLELRMNTSMVPSQEIYIDSVEVVEALATYRTVKTLYRKVFPVGQMFEPSIFGNIKDVIDDVDEEDQNA